MSLAWETTIEDVWNVLDHYGGEHDYEVILGMLDLDAIEGEALLGYDMDQQTDYSFAEIERQLKKKFILPLDANYWNNVAGLSALSSR